MLTAFPHCPDAQQPFPCTPCRRWFSTGFWNTVSVPSGATSCRKGDIAASSRKLAFLHDAMGLLASCRRIVVATDADDPGLAMAAAIYQHLPPDLRARCRHLRWNELRGLHGGPGGFKDANEALMQVGRQGLRQQLQDEYGIAAGDG